MSIINNVLSKVIGSRNDRLIKKYSGQVAKINALEPQMQSMSDDELSSITARLKQREKIMKPRKIFFLRLLQRLERRVKERLD